MLTEGQRQTLVIDLENAPSVRPDPRIVREEPRRAADRVATLPPAPGKVARRLWTFELGALAALMHGEKNDDVLIGGSLFAAFAPSDRWHVGTRGLGGGGVGGNWAVTGGVAFSARVAGPLWAGASAVMGATHQEGLEDVSNPSTPGVS